MEKLKLWGIFFVSLYLLGGIGALSAFEAHVVNVTARVENGLEVTPDDEIDFGTVFPQEKLEKNLMVRLSDSFLDQERVNYVTYTIRQKPKPRPDALSPEGYERVEDYCHGEEPGDREDPTDPYFTYCYPSLCEYLSQKGDGGEEGLSAFSEGERVVSGLLSTPSDTEDEWTVEVDVPCFREQCAQEWDHEGFELPKGFEGETYGCDLWVEVTGITETGEGIGTPKIMETQAISFENEKVQRAEITDPNPVADLTGPFTAEAWVKLSSYDRQVIFGNPGPADSGCTFVLFYNPEREAFQGNMRGASGAWRWLQSSFKPNLGQWYHVALTWDGFLLSMFVDGEAQPWTSWNYGYAPRWNSTDYFVVGGGRTAYHPALESDSRVDELRVSSKARYISNFTPPEREFVPDPYTVALYHFNGNSLDAGGNGAHLTEINSPSYK